MNTKKQDPRPINLFTKEVESPTSKDIKKIGKKKVAKYTDMPDKLGKAIRLTVPDFSDPNRKPTCLEVDFPIAQINALSNLEGNAGKPIYDR